MLRMITTFLYFLMFLLEVHPIPIQSIHEHKLPLITQMIPLQWLEQGIFPYLTAEDIKNFKLFLFQKVSAEFHAILKISDSQIRSAHLKNYLEQYDPSHQHNYLLRYAAAKGMADVVKILLKHERVDPAAKKNWALIMAKENKHQEVCNLLAEVHREGSVEERSSQFLLADILTSGARTSLELAQDIIDLQLLWETSTKLLPHLNQAIIHAIALKRNDLAKRMLYFIIFDHSYFNHLVYFRQLAAGYSIRDLKKVDPFDDAEESLIFRAARAGNIEMVNFILDKGLKWNPLTILWLRYYSNRVSILAKVRDFLLHQRPKPPPPEEALLPNRLQNILIKQLFFVLIFKLSILLRILYGIVYK